MRSLRIDDLGESLAFAAEGKARAHYTTDHLENSSAIFDEMERGAIDGRVVHEDESCWNSLSNQSCDRGSGCQPAPSEAPRAVRS